MTLGEQESSFGAISTTPTDFTSNSSKAITPRIHIRQGKSMEGTQKSEGQWGGNCCEQRIPSDHSHSRVATGISEVTTRTMRLKQRLLLPSYYSPKKDRTVVIESLWPFLRGGGGGGGGPAGVLEGGGGGFPRLKGSDPCIRYGGGGGGASLAPFRIMGGGGGGAARKIHSS